MRGRHPSYAFLAAALAPLLPSFSSSSSISFGPDEPTRRKLCVRVSLAIATTPTSRSKTEDENDDDDEDEDDWE
jgi:hypothetical protein